MIGFTSGVFDLLHVGHVTYLNRCRYLCNHLVVGVDSDALTRLSKGIERPFIPEAERLALVLSLSSVNEAILLRDLHHMHEVVADLADRSNPHGVRLFKHDGFVHTHVIGSDIPGVELVIVPDVAGLVSTTQIVEKIRSRTPYL